MATSELMPPNGRLFKSVPTSSRRRPGTARDVPGLEQCQVETPMEWVRLLWRLVNHLRPNAGDVVDFGAGDGRFALAGTYKAYTGYEIDPSRAATKKLPPNARILHQDASMATEQWDTAVGNPPYARNQDLDAEWRQDVQRTISDATGRRLHGLQNLYQYFMWLSLLRTKEDGLVALIVPYEWVSRPSAQPLRANIRDHGWSVRVYRLPDSRTLFPNVKTTASITIIDKRGSDRSYTYYDIGEDRMMVEMPGPTRAGREFLPYAPHRGSIYATRGFSPGSQHVFCLTEQERQDAGIRKDDVVPCVTTLRHLPASILTLDNKAFEKHYIKADEKCWLLRTDRRPISASVEAWLDAAPDSVKKNSTCALRKVWHQYTTPPSPQVLYAAGFRGPGPKVVENPVRARNVGSVHGVFGAGKDTSALTRHLQRFDFASKIVPQAHGLMKIEVRQMNSVLNAYYQKQPLPR